MKSFRTLLLAMVLAIVAACAQIGLTNADGTFNQKAFDQKVTLTLLTADRVVLLADSLLAARQISASDALNIAAAARAAKTGVDIARGLVATSGAQAAARLDVAAKSVESADAYLGTQGAKK